MSLRTAATQEGGKAKATILEQLRNQHVEVIRKTEQLRAEAEVADLYKMAGLPLPPQ